MKHKSVKDAVKKKRSNLGLAAIGIPVAGSAALGAKLLGHSKVQKVTGVLGEGAKNIPGIKGKAIRFALRHPKLFGRITGGIAGGGLGAHVGSNIGMNVGKNKLVQGVSELLHHGAKNLPGTRGKIIRFALKHPRVVGASLFGAAATVPAAAGYGAYKAIKGK